MHTLIPRLPQASQVNLVKAQERDLLLYISAFLVCVRLLLCKFCG